MKFILKMFISKVVSETLSIHKMNASLHQLLLLKIQKIFQRKKTRLAKLY